MYKSIMKNNAEIVIKLKTPTRTTYTKFVVHKGFYYLKNIRNFTQPNNVYI
jgi:hypothetical protein